MRDDDCVALLTWLLPRLGLRWAGFRAVRRQVCKRIARRLAELRLSDAREYRSYLENHPEEWAVADSFCTVTISSFNRDREVFEFLGRVVLPELAAGATARGERELRAWSAGCASGEEPYTLALVWHFLVATQFPRVNLQILGTDIDPHLLERAESAAYPAGALKHVPPAWLADAFDQQGRHLSPEARIQGPDQSAPARSSARPRRGIIPSHRLPERCFHVFRPRATICSGTDAERQPM